MKVSSCIACTDFPCVDVNKDCYTVPWVEIFPEKISILMISEAPPLEPKDYFYARNNPFYWQTTRQAFNAAGVDVTSMQSLLDLGVYITTAVKCGKIGYSLTTQTIKNCSVILAQELGLFANIKAILLMGDVAIKSLNYIAARETGNRVIPAGSTYKIRKNRFFYKDVRVFPSYLQTGKNFLIEKSKRTMIAEDIKNAIEIIR